MREEMIEETIKEIGMKGETEKIAEIDTTKEEKIRGAQRKVCLTSVNQAIIKMKKRREQRQQKLMMITILRALPKTWTILTMKKTLEVSNDPETSREKKMRGRAASQSRRKSRASSRVGYSLSSRTRSKESYWSSLSLWMLQCLQKILNGQYILSKGIKAWVSRVFS